MDTLTIVYGKADGAPVVDIRKAYASATCEPGGIQPDRRRGPQLDGMKISGHQTDSMIRRYRIVSPKQLRSIGQRVEAYLKGKGLEEAPIQ